MTLPQALLDALDKELEAEGKRLVEALDKWYARHPDVDLQAFDESQHPRAKTTPQSTPGSFAPKGWTDAEHDEYYDLFSKSVHEKLSHSEQERFEELAHKHLMWLNEQHPKEPTPAPKPVTPAEYTPKQLDKIHKEQEKLHQEWLDKQKTHSGPGGPFKVPKELKESKEARTLKEWEASLTNAELGALTDYIDGLYREINGYLRNPKAWEKENPFQADHIKRILPDMKSGLEKAPASKKERETYRGFWIKEKKVAEQIVNGKIFKAKGYVSTSMSQNIARDFSEHGRGGYSFQVKIIGKSGVNVTHISSAHDEKEVLYRHGSRFSVKVDEVKKGTYDTDRTNVRMTWKEL